MANASTIVIETVDNRDYSIRPMEPGERVKRAREARDWSQDDLARRIGISQPAIKKIEDGTTAQSKFLPQVARALDLDISDLVPGPLIAPGNHDTLPASQIMTPDKDFPIHASAEGGAGTIIVSSDAVDFMPRPTPLQHTKDAYGLFIVGTSMEPEFRQGDMALVNPHLAPVGGEVYVFYAEKEGEARATIKHLRRATEDKWLVSQHNPPAGSSCDFTLSRREWQWAHRVIGKYSRR